MEVDLRPGDDVGPWRRTLALMVFLQGVMSISVSVSWPFMPLYVYSLGIHPLTEASLWAGLITGPQFLLAALVSPFWGALADRIGRKPMVLRCAAATTVATACMGLSNNVWQLLGCTVLYGIFSGFYGASVAFVGTQMPERRLGYCLGWMATAQLFGTLIGPLVGGLLSDFLHTYRGVFFFSSGASIIAVTLAAIFLREAHRPPPRALQRAEGRTGLFGGIFATREFAPMFVVLLLSQVAAGALGPIVAPYVRSLLGDSPFVATMAGAAIAVTGIAGLASSPLLGRRSDRVGYRGILLISILGTALFTLPQAFANSIGMFILLRSGVGVFLGGVVPTANAWLGRLYPREQRGRVFGMSAAAQSLGNFFGPVSGGLIAAHFGIPMVFLVVGALMLGNFVWVLIATRREGALA
jgi:DHA1 family multidrug resistance protein-like MFS transporter